MELHGDIEDGYRDFAEYARAESPCFEAWALGVADDAEVRAWLADLPPVKQQPNLVFAAARWHGVRAPAPYDVLRDALLSDDGRIRATILERGTQTNEVGRLATLLPALGLVDGPLALLEVGASAGLCLFPDRYDYAWPPAGDLRGSDGPLLTAAVDGPVPLPERLPDVTWRAGIDLHPLDVADADAMAWLDTLVWPEHDQRRERLLLAVEVARADPPRIVAGDLLEELPGLLGEAAPHGTPVVFHSAVAAYLDHAGRGRFADLMAGLVADGACRWVSNEGPGVVPSVAVPEPRPPGRFVLALDGRAVAWTHGHGQSLTWLG